MNKRLRHVAAVLLCLGAALAAAPSRALDIHKMVTPGGLTVWMVEDHTNPIINLNFAFRGGSAQDPLGKEGLADMTAGLLDEGAGDLDAQAFHGRLEDGSFSIGFGAGLESTGGSLRTLRRNRDEAFDLLRLALAEPRFDEEPVARVRNQMLVGLQQGEEDPGTIANRRFSKMFFPDHPYGRPGNGTRESVQAITRDDMVRLVKEGFGRDNLVIGVVGDTTADEIGSLLDRTFGGLPEKADIRPVAEVKPQASGETIVVRKRVPQSTIVFGQEGLLRDDPDFYAGLVFNYVLGGGSFRSRLWAEVREKRGLAYSINTGLYPMDHAALLMGGAGTDNARVGDTVRLVREEWGRSAAQGITQEELDDAKLYITGSYPLQFSSSGRISSTLVSLQLDRREIDYVIKRNSYVEAVTLEQVNRLAKRLLKPEALTFVVVGEPQGLNENGGESR